MGQSAGHPFTVGLAVALALAIGACAQSAQPPEPPPESTRYEAIGMVLQVGGRVPELCVGATTLELPPSTCRGIPLAGWSWKAVEGEQSMAGRTWGDYLVTGAFDGTTFVLTERAAPAPAVPDRHDPRTPCPEPPGGFRDRLAAQATADRLDRAVALARAHPDLGGLWIDDPGILRPEGQRRAGSRVLNVTFTADLDARRAELEATWGGFVCVTKADRTLATLRQIQSDLVASPQPGLELLGVSVEESDNRVRLWVVVAPPGAQEALDARFGPGAVVLDAALTPRA